MQNLPLEGDCGGFGLGTLCRLPAPAPQLQGSPRRSPTYPSQWSHKLWHIFTTSKSTGKNKQKTTRYTRETGQRGNSNQHKRLSARPLAPRPLTRRIFAQNTHAGYNISNSGHPVPSAAGSLFPFQILLSTSPLHAPLAANVNIADSSDVLFGPAGAFSLLALLDTLTSAYDLVVTCGPW